MPNINDTLSLWGRLRQQQREWEDKTEYRALLAMWLGAGSLCSLVVGLFCRALGIGLGEVALISFVAADILLPAAFLGALRHWRHVLRKRVQSQDVIERLEYEYHRYRQEITDISALPIKATKKEELILAAHKRHDTHVTEIRKSITNISVLTDLQKVIQELSKQAPPGAPFLSDKLMVEPSLEILRYQPEIQKLQSELQRVEEQQQGRA